MNEKNESNMRMGEIVNYTEREKERGGIEGGWGKNKSKAYEQLALILTQRIKYAQIRIIEYLLKHW